MSHTISLPDVLYQQLAAIANQQGKTPDDVINTLVTQYIETTQSVTTPSLADDDELMDGYDPTTDPLAPFIGAFKLGTDRTWVAQHDAIFGNHNANET